jgi:hypothetical protein
MSGKSKTSNKTNANGQGQAGQAVALPIGTPTTSPVTPKVAKAAKPPVVKLTQEQKAERRQARLALLRKNDCLCGCGTKVRHSFAQGHDQRVRGTIARGAVSPVTKAAIAEHILVAAITSPNQPVLL